MAIIKAANSHSNIKNIINYVSKKEKTTEKLLTGINCSSDTALEEMQLTKELYGKEGGRTYKHFVQSFPPDENISSELAHKIANEFVEQCDLLKGYEVLIATHTDKDHVHSHFIINSVSFETGHKFQMSAKDLQKMKDISDSLCRKYNLSICEKGQRKK